ncbi:hypothetical protein [Bradyrhizobium cenepequi]
MTWITKRGKWNWRSFLTKEEADFMREADAEAKRIAVAQSAFQKKYGLQRMKTVNRAIQRAKYAAGQQ